MVSRVSEIFEPQAPRHQMDNVVTYPRGPTGPQPTSASSCLASSSSSSSLSREEQLKTVSVFISGLCFLFYLFCYLSLYINHNVGIRRSCDRKRVVWLLTGCKWRRHLSRLPYPRSGSSSVWCMELPLVIAHNEFVANGKYSDLSVLKKPPSTPPRFVRLQSISPINSTLSNDGSTAMPKRLASLRQSLRSLSNP